MTSSIGTYAYTVVTLTCLLQILNHASQQLIICNMVENRMISITVRRIVENVYQKLSHR